MISPVVPTVSSVARTTFVAMVAILFGHTHHVRAQGSGMQAIEPEPFRADQGEIYGRDFDYPDDAFLLRSFYRFHVDQQDRWRRDLSGYRGLAGSDSSDEFYTFQELRKRIYLEAPFFTELRYRRDEDYDSRYDRAQIGVGSDLGAGWKFALLSEIVAEKEDIDVQPEIEWTDDQGNRLRFAFVLTDATFNRKSDDGEYSKNPYTFFAEATHMFGKGGRITTWINWNPQLEREYLLEAFNFNDRRLFGGFQSVIPFGENWQARFGGHGEIRKASVRYLDTSDIRDRRLSRRMWTLEGQLRRALRKTLTIWAGARYFRFSENERRPRDVILDNKLVRRESTAFVGVDWRVHDRVLIWPGVYVDYLQEREDYPGDPARRDSDRDALVALALPVEIDVGKEAALTIQTSVLVHDFEFGGTGVQLSLPF